MYEITKDLYEISVWDDVLVEAKEQSYELTGKDTPENEVLYKKEGEEYKRLDKEEVYEGEKYVRVPRKLSFFKEEKIAVIGSNEHNSPELAYNPKFVDDVKGEHTLTFTMNGKYYDKEKEEFVDNPYIKYLVNEKKVKLYFRDEWYDLIIKKVEENKKNYSYTYTATDLFINELGKNGFKLELDTELENNQGTAEELAAKVLEGTDWRVSNYSGRPKEGEEKPYESDLIVETNLDTLYRVQLIKNIDVEVSADGWLPIQEEDVEPAFIPTVDDINTVKILAGEEVYLFYSDLVSKNPEPMVLYRAPYRLTEDASYEMGKEYYVLNKSTGKFEEVDINEFEDEVKYYEKGATYETNSNEDIIINSYNFRVTRENKVYYSDDSLPLPNFINMKVGATLEDTRRAYETVRRPKTAYDPITDEFITYFLQRLFTKEYVKTEDIIPYSNKAYFIENKGNYERFYGFVFEDGTYYEEKYVEFLAEEDELKEDVQYYVKSLVPEYVPTTDKLSQPNKKYYRYQNDEYISYTYENIEEIKWDQGFVYEQTGKAIDGFIKFEKSSWSRIKGYTDTEYLSPTLVQNFLVNSMEMSNTAGWIFDGAPSSENRAGELTNRLDDPTLPDPDEDPTSSLLILHLTDTPVHYASQTGELMYTNYDFKPLNSSISKDEFNDPNLFLYEKEEYLGTDPQAPEIKEENGDTIKFFYCTKTVNGYYQTTKKIYIKENDIYKQILRWNGVEREYYKWSAEENKYVSLTDELEEANIYVQGATYYKKNGDIVPEITNKWQFLSYDEQLYFKVRNKLSEEEFYSIVNYKNDTPIYRFVATNDKEPQDNKPYYKVDPLNTLDTFNPVFVLINLVKFKEGVNEYYVKGPDGKYKKTKTKEPIDGEVYYIFAPTGKMHYVSYDFYSSIWENAAIRDYLDSIFLTPDYEIYTYFNQIKKEQMTANGDYWLMRADGTYEKPDEYELTNYTGEYVYEKWEEDAIAEMQSIYRFEYTEDELTAYAKDLLNLVYELLDWADYNQESRLEFLNAIDLFGIKRSILLQKMRTLEKNYPDVEGYQKQALLKYLKILNTDLNQNLRIEMSVIADKRVVNYFPTEDSEGDPNKKYYCFEEIKHPEGEVSRSYMAREYTDKEFYPYPINGVEYKIKVNLPEGASIHDLASLIIYEFEGELIDLIDDVESAIKTITDNEKTQTLRQIEKELKNVSLGSVWTALNPLKVYRAYQSLLKVKDMLEYGSELSQDDAQDLLDLFYGEEGLNIEDLEKNPILFSLQSIFSKSEIDADIFEILMLIKDKINDAKIEDYLKIVEKLQTVARGVTYVRVDTENEEPELGQKYFVKKAEYVSALGEPIHSSETYYKKQSNDKEEILIYSKIPNHDHIPTNEDGLINDNTIYRFYESSYKEVPYELTKWEKDENGKIFDYYIQVKSLVDYSDDVEYNLTLRKALNNLEEIISLKLDDVEELSTGNRIFDEVTKALTGFTIIWHLEKEERQQVIEGTKLLLELSKQLTALQISDDFIDLSNDRRYEAHKRRALNTGFSANREVIKKLNKGEEYVFALSLGRYYEGEEPPVYNKMSSFSYGDIENKYYYFDNDPSGIGDYVLGIEDYKEIMEGEEGYETPYGWAEAEGCYELAGLDSTTGPRFYCIAQETTEGRFITRFVTPDSSELTRVFYYPCEDGDYIYTREVDGLFKTKYSFQKFETYKWANAEWDQVLLNSGVWHVLFNELRPKAKRYRRSPTYICTKVDLGPSLENDIQVIECTTYDSEDFDVENIQVFKRSTDTLYEGKHKKDVVTSIEGIQSDSDFYKKISTNELVAGPLKGETYYVYDAETKTYKPQENLIDFSKDVEYYTLINNRSHFSLYKSEDQLPDLFIFVPDNNGDYVHIIRKESDQVVTKWYEFWKNPDNLNKIYREFKETDDLYTDAPHYFKRYNSQMDYDFHSTSWKDGHIGPWREKYQRYSKYRIHLYDNTELDPQLTYWVSNPFSDGSECYTLYDEAPIQRYTIHKRYKGMVDGIHQYLEEKDIRKLREGQLSTDTANRNVNKVEFYAPPNYKDYNTNNQSLGIKEACFKLNLGLELIPVKISNRAFRPYENETDSQRVPYIMLKTSSNLYPSAGIDWVYSKGVTENDTGYYRACTVDDENLYTNWNMVETVDDLLGLYEFLKIKDPINWNEDSPPFTFAVPMETSLLSYDYAMRVIKSLNTPYWWGRYRYHNMGQIDISQAKLSWFTELLTEFWEWGASKVNITFWKGLTGASSASKFVEDIEEAQDWFDGAFETIAEKIRKIVRLLDISSEDYLANTILGIIDSCGIDILSNDADYIQIDQSKEKPKEGVTYYVIKVVDGKGVYIEQDLPRDDKEQLYFDPNEVYYILETDYEGAEEVGLFQDPLGVSIGIIKHKTNDEIFIYHYFPSEKSGYYEPIHRKNGSWFNKEGNKITSPEYGIYEVNAKIENGYVVAKNSEQLIGDFIKLENGVTFEEGKVYYYYKQSQFTDEDLDTSKNRTYEARLNFWDAMYGLYGTQWSQKVERSRFASGGSAFLNLEDEFTEEVLEEIYAFSELWVKETHAGFTKFIPFDRTLHNGKTKFYRHTYAGQIKDAVEGISEIYYHDGGVYKYYLSKDKTDPFIPINYDGLKVSFCEYDYDASEYKIDPVQIDDSFEQLENYSENHKVYLDFDCSQPINGYFDLTISAEVPAIDTDEEYTPLIKGVKERYVWWKAPVKHNYNLTDNLHSKVGTLFYTDSKSLENYPIASAQMFKYKSYKSNNYDVLMDFKKQFFNYEQNCLNGNITEGNPNGIYEPTFEEYKVLKRAFQGYFGIDEWNKVEELMEIDYLGKQHNSKKYKSYLHMLNEYFSEDGPRVEYIRDRIIYDSGNKTYKLKFENEKPVLPKEEPPIDKVYLTLEYYEGSKKVKEVNPKKAKLENSGLNDYEKEWVQKDLILYIPSFASSNQNLLYSYIKSLIYKYSMREVNKVDESPDKNDIYYIIKNFEDEDKNEIYYERLNGLTDFPSESVYQTRFLTDIEIQESTKVGVDDKGLNNYHLVTRINCLESTGRINVNIKVKYQLLDGVTDIIAYSPEIYYNVPLWANMDEAALAEELEFLAEDRRKDYSLIDRAKDPNPFKHFVCSGIQSELLYADTLDSSSDKVYEIVVQLDNKFTSGHHDISKETGELNIISSFNQKMEELTDTWLAEQEVHLKKALGGVKQGYEETIAFIDTSGSSIIEEVVNFGHKAEEFISDGIDSAAKAISGFFKGIFGTRQTYRMMRAAVETINIDKAVSNSISGILSHELRKDLQDLKKSGINTETGLVLYLSQLSAYYQEIATFITYIQELGYYDFLRDADFSQSDEFFDKFEENFSKDSFINRILTGLYNETISGKTIMALPGEVPDNNDLIFTNYYLYKSGQEDMDTLVYDYVGNDALTYYLYDYDNLCQRVRGIEIKEKNYLSALSAINEKFECWIKYELEHYTEEENAKLPVMEYENAHTPGEVKMVDRAVWVAEDDDTDIFFEPVNIINTHISDKENEAISALSQFNPRTYWYDIIKEQFEEADITSFEENVEYYIVTPTGSFKKVIKEEVQVPDSQVTYYTKKKGYDEELLNKYETVKDKVYLKNIISVPLKTIYLKQFTGDLNYAGFKYGINLKSIKRTLDSKDLVSRLIVKENTNEHAIDGFCTIQRASENPIKESFILNFDYYVQHGMLKRDEVSKDLYGIENGYYSRLAAINEDLDWLVQEIAEVNECLDRINANYETYSLARDAAEEEIEKMAVTLSEVLPDGIPSPWKYDMAKETEVLRTSWSDTQTKQFTTKDKDGNIVEMTEHVVQGQSRAIEIPKYSEDSQKKLKQMDIFQRNHANYSGLAKKAKEQKEIYENKLIELYTKSDEMVRMKNGLNALFFKKYYRFIQEGSWKDDNYMDDTLYYLDALAVARTSAFPKVTYDIQVIDLENLNDYKGYNFGIGDKTYIEDTEFFGYTPSGKPYQEETIITKLEYHLDDSSKNKITVTNYKTQFEDMFKRIAATVAKVELGTGAYNRANAVINETAMGAPAGTTTTVNGLLETVNGSVSIGAEGLVTTEIGVSSNKIKIVNGAIYRSTDGGTTYQKVMTADGGIDPSAIGYGNLDLSSVTIGTKDHPELSFTANGMTAFMKNNNTVDYSTFVRFDNYGMYGIKNYKRNSSTDDASNANLNDVFIPSDIDSIYENASYGLTWDGFFLKTGDGTGRVTIGTNQDFRMSTKNSSDAWQDRIVIGKLQDSEKEYYGFRIIDADGNKVLNTDDRGQLYLRHKLHISHFNDEYGTVTEDNVTIDKKLDQTNITLGIVKAYKRNENGGYNKGEDLHDNYSSLDYLTKVFSVKSVVDGYDLKGALKDKKDFFKQFTKEQLDVLIDSNENLAIFDNGNLYAKNAWIEGNIRAISGNILGKLQVGEKGSVIIDGIDQRIFHSDNGWSINNDGTAHFNNVEISGTITAAVFNYNKIQSIGGAMLVRPSYKVLKHYFNEDKTLLYLELDAPNTILDGFGQGDYCRFGHDFNTSFKAVHKIFDYKNDKDNKPIYNIIIIDLSAYRTEEKTNDNKIIYSNNYETLNIESVISVKQKDKETYGLGLNSTANTNIMPSQSFSLIKMDIKEEELTYTPKLILGKIPSGNDKYALPSTSLAQLVADSNGQYYGLYAENVLLEGALTTISGEYSAGVSTNSVHKINDIDLIFWSGQNNANSEFSPNFYVNREGFLYAKNGLFEGEVVSSTIKTSTIIGNKTGETYGLTILPGEGRGISRAIIFGEGEKVSSSPNEIKITKEYFSLDSQKISASVDFKITSLDNPNEIKYNFGVLRNLENCVGIFGTGEGTNSSNYLLNFTIGNNNEVNLNYSGVQIATIDGNGIHSNRSDNSWGEAVYLEGLTYGCDIYVR